MNRRDFTKLLGASALALGTHQFSFGQRKNAPQVSVTMDDFFWANAIHQSAAERNQSILGTLQSHSLKGALFVIGRNIDGDEGKQLLRPWNDAGHLIGNHTYSHQNYNAPTMTLETFQGDILRAEALLKEFSEFRKFFRFPMLKEGDTLPKRDGLRTFLTTQGYQTGHVTIDGSDWLIDQRLTTRLRENPKADVKPYRDYYLAHMWDRAQYYDALAVRVLGRSVKHTFLVHFNLLNGLFLNDLIVFFKDKGWKFIDASDAFADPIFSAKPNVLPAGESIVWSLAKEKGVLPKAQRYPAEDGDIVAENMKKLGL